MFDSGDEATGSKSLAWSPTTIPLPSPLDELNRSFVGKDDSAPFFLLPILVGFRPMKSGLFVGCGEVRLSSCYSAIEVVLNQHIANCSNRASSFPIHSRMTGGSEQLL